MNDLKNQRKTLILILITALLISLFSLSVYGLNIPKPPGEDIYVQDHAFMLSNEVKEDMLKMSSVLKDLTSAELVVVTVPSMDGRSIEEYALNLFRQWGIGDKDARNGVLLLIAREEREARIEVGYGLEGAITDGKAGAILDEMITYFQVDNYNEGVATAYSLLLNEIAVEYNIEADQIFEGAQAIRPVGLQEPISFVDIIKIIGLLFLVFITIIFALSKLTGKNLFRLLALLLWKFGRGGYGGPTYGGPPYMGGMGRGYGSGPSNNPFGGSSRGGRSTIGRGKFGGGSSGGGGSSRKW